MNSAVYFFASASPRQSASVKIRVHLWPKKSDAHYAIVRPHREMNPPRWPTDCPGDDFPIRGFAVSENEMHLQVGAIAFALQVSIFNFRSRKKTKIECRSRLPNLTA